MRNTSYCVTQERISLTSCPKSCDNQETQSNQNKWHDNRACSHACIHEHGSPHWHIIHWNMNCSYYPNLLKWYSEYTTNDTFLITDCFIQHKHIGKLTKIHLPMQVGRLSLHIPVKVQSSIPVPFSEYPSLQAKKHWEAKLKFPRGWEQFIDRGKCKAWMASHCMAKIQKGHKISCCTIREPGKKV